MVPNELFNARRQAIPMEAPVLRLLDRYLVWFVALLASLEAFGAIAQGVADRRVDHMVIWGVVALAVVAGTALLEMVKSRRVA